MNMIRRIAALAATVALTASLAGCATGEVPAEEVAAASLSPEDVAAATSQVPQLAPEGTDIVAASAEVDEASKTIYLTVQVAGGDAVKAADDAEALCRALSSAAAEAAGTRAADAGDEAAAEAWQQEANELAAPVDEDDDSFGTLFADYGLSVVVDDEAGSLDVDGTRAPGDAGAINWQ